MILRDGRQLKLSRTYREALQSRMRDSEAARQVYIARVDKNEKGGLKQVKPLSVAPDAVSYKAPFEK